MYFLLIAFAAMMLVGMLAQLIPKTKTLGVDILNDYSELKRLEAVGITEIRIFRRRENTNVRLLNNIKLVPFGEYNDVPDAKFYFYTVQDTALVVKGKDIKGNQVIIETYEYNQENKEKALGLKRLIEGTGHVG